MPDITIETDRDGGQLFQWLQEDPDARKVSVTTAGDDADHGGLGAPDTVIAAVNTAIALWSLALSIKSYQRSRHVSRRPVVSFVHKGHRIEIADANRDTLEDFFYGLDNAEDCDGDDA